MKDAQTARWVRSAFGSISVNALLEVDNVFEGKSLRAIPVREQDLETGDLQNFPRIVHYDRRLLKKFDSGNCVIVGREMARYYGWQVGDSIRLYMPRGGELTRNMQIRKEEFVIAGFFRTGFYEFDQNLIFLSLRTAQRVLGFGDVSTEVIVQLKDLAYLDPVAARLRDLIPDNPYLYTVRTIKDERGNFLAALQLEKTLMIIIMGLLIVAGAAGIWVTVHLQVRAKSRSIGMLRAMGLPARSVIIIFTAHSMLIGLLSTLVGGSIGIFVSDRLESIVQLVEDMINSVCGWYYSSCAPVTLIPKNIYYFDHLPVYADLSVIFGIAVTTMILSGLAGFFPSRNSALLDPVYTIRND
jgi:lipoprotein-releasing system permease protein